MGASTEVNAPRSRLGLTDKTRTEKRAGLRLRAWAELAGIWALAFAHNAFERVASGPEAFTSVGADRVDLVLLIVLLALAAPTLAWLIELAIAKFGSERSADWFHAFCVGAGAAIFVGQVAIDRSTPQLLLCAPIAAILVWVAYVRLEAVRYVARILMIATPIVIGLFLISYPTLDVIKPPKAPAPSGKAQADTPVVLIVFDEFSLDYLLRMDGEIDRKLFPNFRKLAKSSTWYRNALTKSSQTLLALPSIMTGLTPDQIAGDSPNLIPPSKSMYPDNLCHIMDRAGFTTHTFETMTDFCGSNYPRSTRLATLASRGAMPPHLPEDHLLKRIDEAITSLAPPYRSDFTSSRYPVIRDFIAGIPAKPRTFNFLHSMLPHTEWMYLPNGQNYPPDLTTPNPWARSPAARDASFQQVMLQTGFVDRQIGHLMKDLRQKGIWDEALVLVTADHGLNLEFNGERRALSEDNAGALLPIPLFVKFPGQSVGESPDHDVSSIDIFPTILDTLGINPGREVDGRSLRKNSPTEPAGRVVAQGYYGSVNISRRKFNRQRLHTQRLRDRLFGTGTFYAIGGFSKLLGAPVAQTRGLNHLPSDLDQRVVHFDPEAQEIPVRWEVNLARPPVGRSRAIALAVNGIVAVTAKAWVEPETKQWKAAAVLPPSAFRRGTNELAAYEINLPGRPRLR